MKQYLLDLYNEHKNSFVKAIVNELKTKGRKVQFNPVIYIELPTTNGEECEEIIEIKFDSKENTWYVHNFINFITMVDLDTKEYWTPLRDLSFDELYQIADRLD